MAGRINRRSCFGRAGGRPGAAGMVAQTGLALGDRAHFLARPGFREALVRGFAGACATRQHAERPSFLGSGGRFPGGGRSWGSPGAG